MDVPISTHIPIPDKTEERRNLSPPADVNAKTFLYVEDIPGNVALVKQIFN